MAESFTPIQTHLTGESAASEIPRQRDEGFSLLEEYPENLRGLQEAPRDEVTGVPLLLYPTEIRRSDRHHPEHPEKHPMLLDPLGLALRGSRIVVVDYDLHHNVEHKTFRGPSLPRTDQEKAARIIFNAAGMIPAKAIVFKGPGEYKLKKLPDDIRLKLWRTKTVREERSVRVREAMQEYLFASAAEMASKKDIKRLLVAEEPAALWEAAKRILSVTALIKTEGIAPQFRSLYEAGLLAPRPETEAWRLNRFVVNLAIGNRDTMRKTAAQALKDRLTAEVDGLGQVAVTAQAA